MPAGTIGIQLDYGYAGQASRHGDEVSRTRPVDANSENIYFGAPVTLNSSGTVSLFGADNTADDFAGIAMRKVKSATVYPYQNFGYYEPKQPCDVLERGGIMAICAMGTPSIGGAVYVRTGVTAGTSPADAKIGDLMAEDESGNAVKLNGVKWSSQKDGRGVAEITIIQRQGV